MAVFIFVWFTSLSMISSRSIHPCCCRWHHCILFYESVVFHCVCVYIHTYVHTTSSFFIHLMMDIEVTPSLVIVNGATLNTGVHCLTPRRVLNGCHLRRFRDGAETLRAAAPLLVFEWASVFENELETSNLLCSLWHQQTDRQADGQSMA